MYLSCLLFHNNPTSLPEHYFYTENLHKPLWLHNKSQLGCKSTSHPNSKCIPIHSVGLWKPCLINHPTAQPMTYTCFLNTALYEHTNTDHCIAGKHYVAIGFSLIN